jgi:transaldolase
MKIFIDSADIEEIREAISWGIVDGITTNPSLIKKAAEKYKTDDMQAYIEKIFAAAR